MSTQISIHGKRTETIYPFMVRYKGKTIMGRYIRVDECEADEPVGIVDDWKIEFDATVRETKNIKPEAIKQAIEDYEKIHN